MMSITLRIEFSMLRYFSFRLLKLSSIFEAFDAIKLS